MQFNKSHPVQVKQFVSANLCIYIETSIFKILKCIWEELKQFYQLSYVCDIKWEYMYKYIKMCD